MKHVCDLCGTPYVICNEIWRLKTLTQKYQGMCVCVCVCVCVKTLDRCLSDTPYCFDVYFVRGNKAYLFVGLSKLMYLRTVMDCLQLVELLRCNLF